ncbi:MAG: hypothetical protein GY904_36780, partial [Planctomycetaceae bacterium]|nr:hypothetical protein [Planctomycetaceae bacterium]
AGGNGAGGNGAGGNGAGGNGAGGNGAGGNGAGAGPYCTAGSCTLQPFPGNGGGSDADGGSGGSSDSVASFDPNEKTPPSGYGDENFVPADIVLPYKVEFENLEDATAPAQRVDVIDPLDPRFDLESFGLTSVAFGDVFIPITGNPQYYRTTVDTVSNGQEIQVEIELGLDYETREIYATFLSIDPTTGLPPSVLNGFLPPEDGTGRGQGYFTYTIRTQTGLPSGTSIDNVALITFDSNETISTDQVDPADPSQGTDPDRRATITIDAGVPESAVEALPAISTLETFTVSWAGTDEVDGSGIATYDIFVAQDGGEYTRWLTETPDTSAEFIGDNGSRYDFYSIAIDNVGHRETPPSTPDASTQVVVSNPWHNIALPHDSNDDGSVTALDALVIINFLSRSGVGPLPSPNGTMPPPYVDVNVDGAATAIDALLVINQLARVLAEGESVNHVVFSAYSLDGTRCQTMPNLFLSEFDEHDSMATDSAELQVLNKYPSRTVVAADTKSQISTEARDSVFADLHEFDLEDLRLETLDHNLTDDTGCLVRA